MSFHEQFIGQLRGPGPILALAPMQDVTHLPFWRVLARYDGADLYFTEYFRVHSTSNLEPWIRESIVRNPTGRPVVAQMIGNDIPALVRTARQLQELPVVAVDLNLGCPAPVVYRKCAGGGLLREPERVDAILDALRQAIAVKFTVKTRVGFDSPAVFEQLLPIFARHKLDLLTIHGRTVTEMYRGEVRYDMIARAAAALPFPVLANGNIDSAARAEAVWRATGARGVMIGRGAIRNPWIFQQIRRRLRGEPATWPTGRQVLEYVTALYESVCDPAVREAAQVQHMKAYLNFIGEGIEPAGRFLHEIRRVTTRAEFFRVCEAYLGHDTPLALETSPAPRRRDGTVLADAG